MKSIFETHTEFKDNLAEFDYETWKKFGLTLYWPSERGKFDVVWPMRILTTRVHPTFQMVALVKEGTLEEVVTFSKDTGRSPTGHCVLMDLDSLRDPIQRANTPGQIFWQMLVYIWKIIRMSKMIVWRIIKERYRQRKSKL
jgi:hypothetical protein